MLLPFDGEKKIYLADRSVSVPMTLSDIERRQTFPDDLHHHAPTVWSITNKFAVLQKSLTLISITYLCCMSYGPSPLSYVQYLPPMRPMWCFVGPARV